MEEILRMYADPKAYREWMRTPFTFEGRSGTTDGITIIFTEGEISDFKPLSKEDAAKVLGVLPTENTKIDFLLSDLTEALQKAPLVDETEPQGEDIECKACDGNGEVEFEFSYQGKTYEHDNDCPVCDGSGYESEEKQVPTGKKIPDPDCIIQFGQTRLKVKYISRLIKVSEHEKEQSFSIVSKSDELSPILFKTGKISILIMPISPGGKYKVIHRFDV